MTRSVLFRSLFAAVMTAALFPAVAFSQDSQSVAEAARRTREKKKDQTKATKVITDETLDVKKGDIQSAVAEEPKMAEASEEKAQPSSSPANVGAASSAAKGDKAEKLKKDLAAAKEQLKDALSDLDLLQRENRLDQDTYYSQPNYGADTAGKQKLDGEKQQISDKQQEIERLKAKIADLQRAVAGSSS